MSRRGTTLKAMIRLLTPPVFVKLATWLSERAGDGSPGLRGDYDRWEQALAASSGYDSEHILEKTRAALMLVRNGAAAYERDSVVFGQIEYSWPLLACLMWVAARCGGQLNVLDFGGSLGGTYYQNRAFVSQLPDVRWNIIEQPGHVATGKRWFEDDRLRFYPDIAACLTATQPNVVLLGSVLQYLEFPYALFDQVLGLPCDFIIIDRTPFWSGTTDRLCVQSVPVSIYRGSYPSWIFSRQRFHAQMSEGWRVLACYDNPDTSAGPVDYVYQGEIMVRRTAVS